MKLLKIAVALAFSVQSTLEDLGKDDEVTKSIERSGRVVNEVLKLFPGIMDNPIVSHAFWEKFKQYRGHPSELRRLGKKEMQNVLSRKEKINEAPLGTTSLYCSANPCLLLTSQPSASKNRSMNSRLTCVSLYVDFL